MATLNLLQGKFTGRLGEVSGSTWKGKPTIRAAVFSKAPPQELQTASVRAFEKLNRISSAIARVGFAHTGLVAKNLHRHNAVARWLKPAIKNHVFEPANIKDVIPQSDDMVLTGWTLNRSTGESVIRIEPAQSFTPVAGSKLFVIVFDDDGRTYYEHCGDLNNFITKIILDTFGGLVYSVLSFYSEPSKKGYTCKNFIYKRGQGMRYSFDEQPTGDLFFDGRPIYQKSVNITIGFSQAGTFTQKLLDMSAIQNFIKSEICHLGGSHDGNLRIVGELLRVTTSGNPPAFTSNFLLANVFYDSSEHAFFIRYNTANMIGGMALLITLFYTKTGDQAVVDG